MITDYKIRRDRLDDSLDLDNFCICDYYANFHVMKNQNPKLCKASAAHQQRTVSCAYVGLWPDCILLGCRQFTLNA